MKLGRNYSTCCKSYKTLAETLINNDSIDTNTNGRYAQVLAQSVIRLGFERLDFWAPVVVRNTAMNGGRVSYKKRVVVIAGSSSSGLTAAVIISRESPGCRGLVTVVTDTGVCSAPAYDEQICLYRYHHFTTGHHGENYT